MQVAYNIKEIRQLYNLTQSEFAVALGITRELVNKMEKGKCAVSKATSALIREFVSERKSEIFSQGENDVQFFGVSTPRGGQPYHLQRREQKNIAAPLQAPLIGIKAQAGYVKGYEQIDYMDTLEKYSLPPGVNPTGATWSYFEVDGESMEPTFYAGDVLLASMLPHEDWNEIRNFYVYVILTETQLLVKRVFRKSEEEWVLISDNEESSPQVILPVNQIKQVWIFRRHIRARAPHPRVFEVNV